MSRRQVKQEATEAFLDANPQLVRYTTHVEVGRADDDHFGGNSFATQSLVKEPFLPPFVAQATVDGEPTFASTAIFDFDEDQTQAFFVDFPGGGLSAGGMLAPDEPEDEWEEDSIFPEEIPVYMPHFDVLSLTENGFGVAQIEDPIMYYKTMEEIIPMEPSGNDSALDGDEIIFLEVQSPFRGDYGPNVRTLAEEEDPAPAFEMGGKELGVGFKVLGGTGTVRVELFDRDAEEGNDDPLVFEMAAGGRGRRGLKEGYIEADMDGDSAFDFATISVTGTLEIAVTGIDLSNNFQLFDIT